MRGNIHSNNAFVVVKLVESLAGIEPCAMCNIDIPKATLFGCISALYCLPIPYRTVFSMLGSVLSSAYFFLSFVLFFSSFRSFFQSRVTLECVYDLKPRYIHFVRPTIMMTSLKQTKVANKRQTYREIRNKTNEKFRLSGIKCECKRKNTSSISHVVWA